MKPEKKPKGQIKPCHKVPTLRTATPPPLTDFCLKNIYISFYLERNFKFLKKLRPLK